MQLPRRVHHILCRFGGPPPPSLPPPDLHHPLTTRLLPPESAKDSPATVYIGGMDAGPSTKASAPGGWGFAFWMVFLSSVIVDMLSALDLTAVSTALPTIVNSLNGTDFIWAGGAYTVASSAVLPFIGNLVAAFGRKPVLTVFILAFLLGSAISGAAYNMEMLIAGRALQGFGGGGCFSITEIIYADLVPLHERGKLQGMTSAAWALACAVGPPIGGALAQRGWWRWLFFLNVPVCAIALLLNMIYLRPDAPRGSLWDKLSQMDIIGATLMTGSTVSVFLAITWGGLQYPWISPQVLGPLIVGLSGMGVFFAIERSWLKRPTVPRLFYTNRSTFGGYVGTFFHGIASLAILYYYPVYLQAAQGASPLGADVDLLPLAIWVPTAAIATGLSIQYINGYRLQTYVGWAFMLLGFGILSILDQHSSRAMFIGLQVPVAIGIGTLWISPQFAVLAPMPSSDVPHALAFFTFTRVVAQGWGIVIGGTILQNMLLRDLPPSFTARLPGGVQIAYAAIETIPRLPDGLRGEVRAAFAHSTRLIWLVMVGVSGAGLLSSLLLRDIGLRQDVEEGAWDLKQAPTPPPPPPAQEYAEVAPESPVQDNPEAGLLPLPR